MHLHSPMRATVRDEVVSRTRRQTRELRRDPLFLEWRREIEEALAAPDGNSAAVLRWITAAYQDAVVQRVGHGERARSARRNNGANDDEEKAAEAPSTQFDLVGADLPFALLGTFYQRSLAEETRLAALLEVVVTRHPAWPWLGGIAGIGTTLSARLLSRLDIRRAPTPSSFWAYCGLATVPGTLYCCAVCEVKVAGASFAREMPPHLSPDGTFCPSKEGHPDPAAAARIAQPRPRAGESRRYDATARAACYLIGVSFARKGKGYKEVLQARHEHLVRVHPEWPARRLYLSAQRVAVKRFLADLWVEWRVAEGLPVTTPYALHPPRLQRAAARATDVLVPPAVDATASLGVAAD